MRVINAMRFEGRGKRKNKIEINIADSENLNSLEFMHLSVL